MMDGKIIKRHFEEEHYRILFNQKTGFFMRYEDEGYPEPLWSMHGPELLDISITNYCERGCSFCYRSSSPSGRHMSVNDYNIVISQARDMGVLQVALGGGNPNQHPDFIRILELTRAAGIIPSYTTNGEGLTEDVLETTAVNCGAIAISFYPSNGKEFYESLFEKTRKYGIKTNLHVIISTETVDTVESLMENKASWLDSVNAIVFLNYKPVGRAQLKDELTLAPERAEQFFKIVAGSNRKIGFDSCSISGICQWMNIKPELVEACEAARFSAFISEDMKMYPCSFMVDKGFYGDLRQNSLLKVWQNNEYFKLFRERDVLEKCKGCMVSSICNGGCRLYPSINFC